MNGYVCFYNGKRIELIADSLWEAKQKAINQFKVRKSQEHMVSVVLAEKDGDPILQTGASL